MYANNPNPTQTYGVLATMVTSAKVPDDVVYQLVKAVFDNFDEFKKLHPAFANLDPKDMVKDGLSAPLHPGAIEILQGKRLDEVRGESGRAPAAASTAMTRKRLRDGPTRSRATSTSSNWWPRPTPAGASPPGSRRRIIFAIALAWSLFQLWYASPLPFMLDFGIFNDTEARFFHLSFAFLLAFTTFPALRSSPRERIPAQRLGSGADRPRRRAVSPGRFYREISLRPGLPTTADIVVSVVGVVLLIEASRRAVGPCARRHRDLDARLCLRRAPGCPD